MPLTIGRVLQERYRIDAFGKGDVFRKADAKLIAVATGDP
jgi:hypothetical protein